MQHFKNIEDMLSNQFEKDEEKDSLGNPIHTTGNPIPEDEYLKEKTHSITNKIKNIYEKSIRKNQYKENGQAYLTKEGEEICYRSLFSQDTQTLDNDARAGEVWEKANNPQAGFNRLNNLQEGEFAYIENRYIQTGMFDFTSRGNGKINSTDDVAFIFRKLESQAVEHIFAVYVDKDKNPVVQWLSMGGTASAVMDIKLCADAAERFQAKEIYFVHNHPSGNLQESKEDRNVLQKLTNAFATFGISIHGIIINLNSGHYSIFREDGVNIKTHIRGDFTEQHRVPILSFSERAFLKSPLDTKIRTSKDVAQFLSQQRFSLEDKSGYLLLDTTQHIIGNFFATKKRLKQATKEAALLASRYGATKLIAYTNTANTEKSAYYRGLRDNLDDFNIALLDAIQVDPSELAIQTYYSYVSLADEGWRFNVEEKSQNYPTHSSQSEPQEHAKVINGLPDSFYRLYATHNGQTKQELEKNITDDLQENKGENLLGYLKEHLEESKWNYEQSRTDETAGMISRAENYIKSNGLNKSNTQKESPTPTELELKVLDNIVNSDYQSFRLDNPLIANSPVWSFSVTNETKELAGALGSCVKKGWAASSTDAGDKEEKACCWLTEAGRTVLLQNNLKIEHAINLIIGQLKLFTDATAVPDKKRAYTTLVRNERYEIGTTDLDTKGVTETGIEIPATTYEEAKRITDRVNKAFFPNNTIADNLMIVAGTMSGESLAKEQAENYIPGIDAYNINEIKNNYSSSLKLNTMEQKNFDYLNNQLFYHGFGNELSEALKEKMSTGKESFELTVTKSFWTPEDFSNPKETAHNKNDVAYTLHFSKSKEGDMYFLNSYTAQLPYKEQAENTFYFNGGKSFTAKEAYNMLEGRAVYKELVSQTGESYHAWVMLGDPDENGKRKMVMYHDKYGFNIEEALDKLTLVKGAPEDKERLITSLKKGNIQTVLLKGANDNPEWGFIVANPKGWRIDIYNDKGRMLAHVQGGQEKSQNNKVSGNTQLSEASQSYASIKR